MKKIGEYTARGRIEHRFIQRITLFDGCFNTGYKVISFELLTDDPTTALNDVSGTLATEEAAATSEWNLADVRQIGWAGHEVRQGGPAESGGAVDPDNFIVEDLYVYGFNAAGTNNYINYIITMEKYETTDWRGALAMVRNSAQSS
jgi:hypothetical protein